MTTATQLLKALADESNAQTLDLTFLEIQGTLEEIVEVLNRIRALGLSDRIRKLDLSGNGLTYLPERLFQGLTELRNLNLKQNQLSSLPEGLFQGLTELRLLYLQQNQLSSLPEGLFQGLTKLLEIMLGRNQFSSLPEGVFQGLTALRYLDLERNHFSVLPPELLEGLALAPGQPSLRGNFNFGPEGEIQTPAGISMSSVKEVFSRIMAGHRYNLDILDRAIDNAYPGFTFSNEQIKTLDEARTGASIVFQCFGEQGVPEEIGDFTLSLTGHHHPKPKP